MMLLIDGTLIKMPVGIVLDNLRICLIQLKTLLMVELVQLLKQQQAVASQQQKEAALPSSASTPSTPDSEQGGANPVAETEKK